MDETRSRVPFAILLMALSTFFFMLMTLCIKYAGVLEAALGFRTFGALEAVFLRCAPMALWCAFHLWRDSRRGLFVPKELPLRTLWWLASRGLVGATSMACMFYASLNIPLATTSLLANTSVFFTGVLAHFFLGERLTARRLALVLCGFACVGLILVEGILEVRFEAGIGYGAALVSGFLTSVAYFSVRKLKAIPTNLVIFSLALAGVLLPWIGLLLPDGLTWPRTQQGWTLLLLSSVPALLGQFAMTAALRLGPAGVVSTGQYMGPVFGAAAGILFFQESLSMLKIMGGLGVICFGVAIPVMRWHRLGK